MPFISLQDSSEVTVEVTVTKASWWTIPVFVAALLVLTPVVEGRVSSKATKCYQNVGLSPVSK